MLRCLLFLSLWTLCNAFQVTVSDTDLEKQICSGMWGGDKAHINVSFDDPSQGEVAMVIYEWGDATRLGHSSSRIDDSLPKTYICTDDALSRGFCNPSELGHFIFDLPPNVSRNSTSFWEGRISFRPHSSSPSTQELSAGGASFWDNPEGNPNPPKSEYDSPFLKRASRNEEISRRHASPMSRDLSSPPLVQRQNSSDASSPQSTISYHDPIKYNVRATGYYCVVIIPLTVDSGHAGYTGAVLFQNTFDGKLPATDYPKVNFYMVMFFAYCALGGAWALSCFRHRDELLPIQYYISGLVGFLIIEMVATWAYYRYLNAHGQSTASTVFLFVVAILDAGRNALSFFLLLIVSLGLSVVRESLGRTMIRCRILTVAHFIFGVLYAVGIVELRLESTTALVLLFFIIPLAFTLSGFMLWIMYALNGTISELHARKQNYKLSMFRRLYYVLMATIACIFGFFVLSTMQFSSRLQEDYAAKSWRTRWWLLDGFLVLLYLVVFWAIAYLWRPTEHNKR